MSCEIAVFGMKIDQFEQSLDFLKYSGKVYGIFNNITIDNGLGYITQVPVEGLSATYPHGSLGGVIAQQCKNIKYRRENSSIYGPFDRQKTASVLIDNCINGSNGT